MSTRHINVLESEKHTPKGFPSSPTFGFATKDENGNSTYQEPNTLPSCLAFVDGNAVPPTTNNGDIYVLIDEGNGSVNTDWNGASYNDFVRFSSGIWVAFNPFNGVTIFNKTDNLYYLYNSGWSVFVPEVPTLYTQNGSIPTTTNREVTIPADSSLDLLGRVGIGKTPNASAILDASVSNKGLRLPQGDEADMTGISTPADWMLYQRNDLNGAIWMYNPDVTDWVPLTVGYGIVSVNDSNGIPTYYANLQTAHDNSVDFGVITLHSNIDLLSQLNISKLLTINMNGYDISFNSATTSNTIDIAGFSVGVDINTNFFKFIGGGRIIRTGGTGSLTNSLCVRYTESPCLDLGTTELVNTFGTSIYLLGSFCVNGIFTAEQTAVRSASNLTETPVLTNARIHSINGDGFNANGTGDFAFKSHITAPNSNGCSGRASAKDCLIVAGGSGINATRSDATGNTIISGGNGISTSIAGVNIVRNTINSGGIGITGSGILDITFNKIKSAGAGISVTDGGEIEYNKIETTGAVGVAISVGANVRNNNIKVLWNNAGGHGVTLNNPSTHEVSNNRIEVTNASAFGIRSTNASTFVSHFKNTYVGCTTKTSIATANLQTTPQDSLGEILKD